MEAAESLLQGFVVSDEPGQVQENVYVILGHGNYQRHVLLCGTLSMFVMFLNTHAHKLVGNTVDHWCRPPDDLRQLGAAEWRNKAIPVQPDGTFNRCTVNDPPMPVRMRPFLTAEHCQLRMHWVPFYVSNESVQKAFEDFGHVTDVTREQWNCPGFEDIESTTRLVRMVLKEGFSINDLPHMFKFYGGTGLTVSGSAHSIVMLLYILLYEVTGSERRFVFVLIDTALPFTLVPRMVEALSWLRPHWFLVQVFILVPTGLLASCCYLLEESPVWLLATWRLQEAEQLMLAAARQNGVNQTRARNSYRLLREQLAKVQAEASSCGFNSRLRVAHFHTRVVTVALSWFTLTLVLYSFTLRPAEPPNEILELVHMCLQALCYVLIYRYMHLRGHLSGLLVGFGLLGASMILQAVFAYGAQEHAARLSEMVVHCASYCAVSLIYGYTAEVYPTWLPEVVVVQQPKTKALKALSVEERKEAIKASLTPQRHRRAGSGHSTPRLSQTSPSQSPYSSLAPSFIRMSPHLY
ncbi:hypothetical protein V5799_021185 [Amblyomma americanum]|uniref:Organic cation/carnitine transporter n=1 Tax=Amblyomma americanum TaxID=6943 RepID=A0AAQ4FPA0_AMBAM